MGSISIQPNADALNLAWQRRKQEKGKPILLTIAEACDCLRVSRDSIYHLLNERKLASVRIRSRRLIPMTEIEDFIAREVEEAI